MELLLADNETLGNSIRAAVDPNADWHDQIRQAVEAYVTHIESRPAVTLSWIREFPSLGAAAYPVSAAAWATNQPADRAQRQPWVPAG